MSKQNKILIAVMLIVIVTAVIFWPKKTKAQKLQEQYNLPGTGGEKASGNSNTGGAAASSIPPVIPGVPVDVKDAFPLKLGSRGDRVRKLQQIINYSIRKQNRKEPTIAEDGVFGNKTLAAVRIWFPGGEVWETLYNLLVLNYNSGYAIGEKNPNLGQKAPSKNFNPFDILSWPLIKI